MTLNMSAPVNTHELRTQSTPHMLRTHTHASIQHTHINYLYYITNCSETGRFCTEVVGNACKHALSLLETVLGQLSIDKYTFVSFLEDLCTSGLYIAHEASAEQLSTPACRNRPGKDISKC
jgi:hypothetical protein